MMPSDAPDNVRKYPYCNPINLDTSYEETRFRWMVRDILDLDPFVRDQAIFEELRRLKKLERA